MDIEKYELTDEEINQIRNNIDQRDLTFVLSIIGIYCREVADAATTKVLKVKAEELAKLTPEKLKEDIRELCLRYLELCKIRDDYTAYMVEPELTDQILSLVPPYIEKAKKDGIKEVVEFINNLIIGIDGVKFEERFDGDKGCIVLDMNENQWQSKLKEWGIALQDKD